MYVENAIFFAGTRVANEKIVSAGISVDFDNHFAGLVRHQANKYVIAAIDLRENRRQVVEVEVVSSETVQVEFIDLGRDDIVDDSDFRPGIVQVVDKGLLYRNEPKPLPGRIASRI